MIWRRHALLTLLLAAQGLAAASDQASAEIEHLLEFVGSSGCQFIRNGSDYDSAAAEAHLRLKYRRGARYVSTAEDFISRLASESSWTGRDYTVQCPGQAERPSREWLEEELHEWREQQVLSPESAPLAGD